ncbi:MAG: 30S ribosomal protein S7, partial [Eubacteriaceae bacterium]
IIAQKTGKEPLEAFEESLNNIKPMLEVKARRVGGATYQVPIEVSEARKQTLALRWLVGYSKKRNEKTMRERLAAEIIDALNNTGASIKKKEETYRMAEANRAFAHYRW